MTITEIYSLFIKSSGISTDTRNIKRDSMFFALKGANFNGNKFAKEAIEKGAKFCIVDEEEFSNNKTIFLVEDVLKVLQDLATYHRKLLKTPIVALTGSNGKTTTKELIHAVLKTQYQTKATQGNLNNHIGVPLSLLELNSNTELGIIEMGANHLGEIEMLCNIAFPDFGLITNFGKAHIEGFGSEEGVIRGKSELYAHLKKRNKLIFVNADYAQQLLQIGRYSNLFRYGNSSEVDVQVSKIKSQSGYVSARLNKLTITSNLIGDYNFNNIAYAITIGKYFKISETNIKSAIESYIPKNNRSQIIEQRTNKIILDAYNANPSSMKAALEYFKSIKHVNKMVILGDMFELGHTANKEHQQLVNYVEANFHGPNYFIGKHFINSKMHNDHSYQFETFEEFSEYFKKLSRPDNLYILIKGSRGMALERTVELL